MHCFDCLSFQAISRSALNLAPVNVNGAMNIYFECRACQMLCKKGVVPDSGGSARSICLSEGGRKTRRYQCVSFLPHIHQRAAVRQPKKRAPGESAQHFLLYSLATGPRQRDNLSLIVSHFPSASSRSDAGGVVKWNTYTNMRKQTQTQRPCAMRPFFIVIMTGPRELSANTADLYIGSPLQREQVRV